MTISLIVLVVLCFSSVIVVGVAGVVLAIFLFSQKSKSESHHD